MKTKKKQSEICTKSLKIIAKFNEISTGSFSLIAKNHNYRVLTRFMILIQIKYFLLWDQQMYVTKKLFCPFLKILLFLNL